MPHEQSIMEKLDQLSRDQCHFHDLLHHIANQNKALLSLFKKGATDSELDTILAALAANSEKLKAAPVLPPDA